MGQINSTGNRGRPQREEQSAAGQPSSSTVVPDSSSAVSGPRTSAERRGRRKSIRNSIIDFVHPKTSRTDGSNASRNRSGRRPWRWTIAGRARRSDPQDGFNGEQDSSTSPSQGNGNAHTGTGGGSSERPNNLGSSSHDNQTLLDSTSEARGSNAIQAQDADQTISPKGKERSSEVSNNSAGSSIAPSSHSGNGVHNNQLASSSNSTSLPSTTVNGSSLGGSSSSAVPSTLPTSRRSTSNNNPGRRFPPAGTLVVVQGVVRTDSPLTLSQGDLPSPAVVAGPASGPSFVPEQDPASHDRHAINEASEFREASSSPISGLGDTSNASGSHLFGSRPTSSASSGDINTSSSRESTNGSPAADVLGALLSIVSVATAATAASLLTTIGSSGPGAPTPSEPPSFPINPSESESNVSEGPDIPSIARALASANPTAAAVLAQRDRDREERERNRARSIWEGLRERVTSGRNRNMPGIGTPSLFNEIASAFNMGPIPDDRPMDSQNAPSDHANSDGDQGTAPRTPPGDLEDLAPGSFDRFLVDLQSDLRLALTRPNTAPSAMSHESEAVAEPPLAGALPRSEPNSSEDRDSDDLANQAPFVIPGGFREAVDDDAFVAGSTSVPEPALASVSNENQSASVQDEGRVSSNSQASASAAPLNRAIWWRMYRFPPILSLRPRQQHDAGQNSPQTNGGLTSPEPNHAARISGSFFQNTPAAQGALPLLEPAVLIPVIVVGLQSVSSDVQNAHSETTEPATGRNDEFGEGARQADVSQHGSSFSAGAGQRARDTWPSRAARAFNRLGRRDNPTEPVSDTANPTDGAHTFLIYVFGGHYPPDHQILSGPDATDSFEALWELADFLGQVKPPVVTEEDIERSGLELFKAVALQEYVSSGRVASNCLDRCLICLDDYNPDDELRLLTCKHTFHKGCVDRWLKTGRNNCPACRSEGVKTTSNAFTSSQHSTTEA